jgi:four helix bundle protein
MNYVEDLESFKLAHSLTLDLYRLTEEFVGPRQRKLGNKIIDRTEEINANLLAGSKLDSFELYKKAVTKSKLLIGQLDYYLLLAKDLDYLSAGDYSDLKQQLEELSQILSGMKKAL